MDMDIDTSELEDHSYQCLDDCGLCCLCQPELDDDELEIFKEAGLENRLTNYHVQGQRTDEPTAIKLQGGRGACNFLRGMRCQIHDIRPRPCRHFPVQIHLLRRVQLNANLACPGIEKGGDVLSAFGKDIISNIPQDELKDVFERTLARVRDFDERTLDFSVYQDPGALKELGVQLIDDMKDQDWISRLLAWSNEEPYDIDVKSPDLLSSILTHDTEPDIQVIASEGNYDDMDLDDLSQIPVFVDNDLEWTALRAVKGNLEVMKMEENGSLETLHTIPFDDVKLLPWSKDAHSGFKDYAHLLNNRDPFMGYVYQVCADQDYQFDLATVYFGSMATTMLDLWWRASLVGHLKGAKKLDNVLAREGIRSYDMTCLCMPTIGEFI